MTNAEYVNKLDAEQPHKELERLKCVVALETSKWTLNSEGLNEATPLQYFFYLGATMETSSTDQSWWHSSWLSSADPSNITMNNINLSNCSQPSLFWFYNVFFFIGCQSNQSRIVLLFFLLLCWHYCSLRNDNKWFLMYFFIMRLSG